MSVQQPVDSAQDDGDTGGEDANFIHGVQGSYSGNVFQWGTRMTPAWQSIATSPVDEMTYCWAHGGRGQSGHQVEPASYFFHGSFAAQPGDAIDLATQFTFECVVNGKDATCRGTLYATYDIVR